MEHKVERHKRGWASVELQVCGHIVVKTVVGIYKTKAEAEGHWNAARS